MEQRLQELADKLGILTSYTDAGLKAQTYQVSEETVRYFVKELGYNAESNEDIADSIHSIDNRRWENALESIHIFVEDSKKFDVVLPEGHVNENISLVLTSRQNSSKMLADIKVSYTGEKKELGNKIYEKLFININSSLNIGYYDAELKVGRKKYKTILAVAPRKCYEPDELEHKKLWGYAIQLYSLKSKRNWGVGDFTDLAGVVDICDDSGANVIGLNPINVLGHSFPEEASPYSSVSRLFLNPIYIDVEAVPEFKVSDKKDIEGEIENLNWAEAIDYGRVYPLKINILEKLFKRMSNKKRKESFKKFCQEKGEDLDNLVTFQLLYEDNWRDHWGGWKSWDKKYHNPKSAAVKQYREENKDRLDFMKFLQFEADRQFNLIAEKVKNVGLKIGIYRDLAVGVGRDSAEIWGDEDLYFKTSGAGAPPDAFFPSGQKWNLGAFHPLKLKERAYEPFIKILRESSKGAGALRIDHVMFLMRLFIIPEEAGKAGTYILYNFEDMLNIVAIESCLGKYMVVGESIGNVPEGFIERIQSRNIYSMSVLWAERHDAGWGDFVSPYSYPENVFVSVGTHDMAPLKAWWVGYDISTSRCVDIIPTDQEMYDFYHKREADRWKLLKALDEAGVWPEDNYRHGDYIYGEGYPEGIEEAVHRFVARSNAKVFLVHPEDVFQIDKMQNLPGTDRDKHPNWRMKLTVNLEDNAYNLAYYRNISAIKKER